MQKQKNQNSINFKMATKEQKNSSSDSPNIDNKQRSRNFEALRAKLLSTGKKSCTKQSVFFNHFIRDAQHIKRRNCLSYVLSTNHLTSMITTLQNQLPQKNSTTQSSKQRTERHSDQMDLRLNFTKAIGT